MDNQISNVSNLYSNAILYLSDIDVSKTLKAFGISKTVYKKLMAGNVDTLNLITVSRLAGNLGLGISELFIDPDDVNAYHCWYAGTSVKYFVNNLTAYVAESGLSQAKICRIAGLERHTVSRLINQQDAIGSLPMLGNLQKLADALQIEVADLFLPD